MSGRHVRNVIAIGFTIYTLAWIGVAITVNFVSRLADAVFTN